MATLLLMALDSVARWYMQLANEARADVARMGAAEFARNPSWIDLVC